MDCMDRMDGAKRVVGLPPDKRKAGCWTPPCPPQEGDAQSDEELGSGRPAPKGRYPINRRSRPTAAPRQARVRQAVPLLRGCPQGGGVRRPRQAQPRRGDSS